MKAICVGHSSYDITLPCDKFPEENIKHRIKKQIECGGGPASNGGYLLHKWGIPTTMMSVLGDDYYADKIIEDFTNINASTEFLEKMSNHFTSNSYIIANMSNGSRTIITAKDEPIRKLSLNTNINADLILVDGEHPETAIEVIKNNPNAISILDAGRLNDDTKEIGKLVTYVVCSKEFAEQFSNIDIDVANTQTIVNAYKKLKEYFNTNIVITLEAAGSFTEIDEIYTLVPSIKVKALDSTGAGDIFHGAFAYFIAKGYSLLDTIKHSSVTAAISVTRIGSRYSIPELQEVFNYDDII